MLALYDWSSLTEAAKKALISRPKSLVELNTQVKSIIDTVREEGDVALIRFTRQWDKVSLENLQLTEAEINAASISREALKAIQAAIQTIGRYHKKQLPKSRKITTARGISIQRLYRPIDRVGLYVPGGNQAPLVSSLLMQAIPARIAGCPTRILCTPANQDGKVDPHLLVAARLTGIKTIYALGGAQAIAAMAYGTASVQKVDKIFGPGNAYVTEAKTQVSIDPEGAAIDLPAGPSEVLVLSDDYAKPEFIAADLLAQLEHGADSQALCLVDSQAMAKKIVVAVNQQFQSLSRQTLIKKSAAHSAIIVCPNKAEQLAIINAYAPEHLIINRRDASDWVDGIRSSGTIFLGEWASETMGDYITGSNHVLPTHGWAKSHSGLGTEAFLKTISLQSVSKLGLSKLGKEAITLAQLEGLDAHANAISQRFNLLENMHVGT